MNTICKGRARRALAVATALGTAVGVLMVPGSASAVTNTLTVTTLTRSGAHIAVHVAATNLRTGVAYSLTSGTAKTLPAGKYSVITDIYNPGDSTDTLGARIVTVSGATKTTIDARAGKPVGIRLSPEPVNGAPQVTAVICAVGQLSSAWGGFNSPGNIFVIPNASSSLEFATQTTWLVPDAVDAGTGYVVLRSVKGVPNGYTPTVSASTLGGARFDVRRGPAGAPGIMASVRPGGDGCASTLGGGLANQDAPYHLQTYLSPGAWQLQADNTIGSWYRQLTVTSGSQSTQSFFNSAWGPAKRLPYTVRGQLNFIAEDMFTDPLLTGPFSSEASTKATMTLSRSGTVLKKKTGQSLFDPSTLDFQYHLGSAGWYQLTVDAKRYRPDVVFPTDMLSTRATASFTFYADPAIDRVARLYLVRFVPKGLGMTNTAAPGSTTTVALGLDRPRQDPDAALTAVTLKSLAVQASYDGGATWHAVTATQTSGRWTAAVPNPSAGTVSLRATATSGTGDRSVITVYKAYTIG